jgi:hypothetical protein
MAGAAFSLVLTGKSSYRVGFPDRHEGNRERYEQRQQQHKSGQHKSPKIN